MAGAVSDREQRILGIIETARGKRAKFRDERITMAHGAGGKATQTLIEGLLVPALSDADAVDAPLQEMGDAGFVAFGDTELAFTTDSYVVKPLRFPGGSIGELAVNGTANDLAVSGARPLALSLSLILEEGLASEILRRRGAGDRRRRPRGWGVGGHRRHQGRGARPRRRHVHLHGRDRPARPARPPVPRRSAPWRPDPALGCDRRARHGDHAGPQRVRARRRDRVRHALPVAGGRRAARGGRRRSCVACATRPAAASPRSSTSWPGPRRWR